MALLPGIEVISPFHVNGLICGELNRYNNTKCLNAQCASERADHSDVQVPAWSICVRPGGGELNIGLLDAAHQKLTDNADKRRLEQARGSEHKYKVSWRHLIPMPVQPCE